MHNIIKNDNTILLTKYIITVKKQNEKTTAKNIENTAFVCYDNEEL